LAGVKGKEFARSDDHARRSGFQQRGEARLLEMLVAREGFANACWSSRLIKPTK